MNRSELIRRYRDGYAAVVAALGEVDLDATVPTGEWNPRQIVHHLADAEMVRAVRLRRLLTEECPQLDGWEENDYADRLRYDRPIDASLATIAALVASNVELVETMSDADWQREGTHSELGRFGMERWVERAAGHIHEHAEQIRRCGR
jgi:hypothetical protein